MLKCLNYKITKLLSSELTSDEDVGKNPVFYIIICHAYIQATDYFKYNRRGSSPRGVCRCVSYRPVLSTYCN